MKNPLPKIAALALLMSCAAPVSAQPPVADPVAPALEIQISSSQKQGKEYLTLIGKRPALTLIFRNASAQPIQLVGEGNSWGYDNIHLEITAINGKNLPQPLIVKKGGPNASGSMRWYENSFYTETLAPSHSMIREIPLHMPAAVRHPDTLPTQEEINRDELPTDDIKKKEYFFFPFATRYNTKTIIMKAVYEVYKEPLWIWNELPNIWTGRVESPLLTYEISGHTFGL